MLYYHFQAPSNDKGYIIKGNQTETTPVTWMAKMLTCCQIKWFFLLFLAAVLSQKCCTVYS